jgi:hypothetical protein
MNHDELVESLRSHGTPEGLIHAVLSELSYNEVEIHLADICATSRVLLNCGGKQGGSDTPGLWNRYLDSAWQKAEKRFILEDLGFCMEMFDGTMRTIRGQFWADDIYLYGCSQEMCSRMFAILTEEIQALKLSWKLDSLQILDNTAVETLPCELQWVNACGTFTISSRMYLDILGTRVDRTGSTKCTMNHRASKLFASWSQVRSQFAAGVFHWRSVCENYLKSLAGHSCSIVVAGLLMVSWLRKSALGKGTCYGRCCVDIKQRARHGTTST